MSEALRQDASGKSLGSEREEDLGEKDLQKGREVRNGGRAKSTLKGKTREATKMELRRGSSSEGGKLSHLVSLGCQGTHGERWLYLGGKRNGKKKEKKLKEKDGRNSPAIIKKKGNDRGDAKGSRFKSTG